MIDRRLTAGAGAMKATVLVLLATGGLLLTSVGSYATLSKRPLPMRDGCLTKAERKHVIRFVASDGTRLIGVELGTGARGVVVGHELRGTLCSWLPYGRAVAAQGFHVLAFDFRSRGSSGGRTLAHFDLDFVAATNVMRRRGARSIVLAGASMGGTAALSAAAQISPQVDGVVSLSGPREFAGVDAGAAVGRLSLPLLFVVSSDDEPFPDDARFLYDAAASTDKQLEILPGYRHGTQLLSGADGNASSLLDRFLQLHSAPS